ncbi:MAG TPA: sigma-70 family RNA polymerase sigma factor [Candidatus Saccharimonadales bacterium]|jgi:RNA polymerase sigma-70 factor (ECF subfamily)|nr:sigma-70 family RNA polymerase sigma factor [Candidatus Saccharimonadales bacterium]
MADKKDERQNESRPITLLLAAVKDGDKAAEAQLIPLVYKELHRLARHYMRGEREGHTLQTSALVNEAYLRLTGHHEVDFKNRGHFFAVSAQIMRRILVDHARSRDAGKRGSGVEKISLENALVYTDGESWQVIALHEALTKLEQWDPRQCRIVELRFFCGLEVEETAEVLSVSTATVKRDFQQAKAWLHAELSKTIGD